MPGGGRGGDVSPQVRAIPAIDYIIGGAKT